MKEIEFASKLVQEYLTGKEIGVLATSNPDGSPLAMPMWFIHDSDGLALVSQAAVSYTHLTLPTKAWV